MKLKFILFALIASLAVPSFGQTAAEIEEYRLNARRGETFDQYKARVQREKRQGRVSTALTVIGAYKQNADRSKLEAERKKGFAIHPVKTPRTIDLGLPSGLLWGSFNLGADKPEGAGNLYAWAETTPKNSFTKSNYKGLDLNFLSSKKITDISGTKYDPVKVSLGEDWRMPRMEDFQELIRECVFQSITVNGTEGYKFTGPNGNSIFLPCIETQTYDQYFTIDASYWTSTMSDSESAHYLWGLHNIQYCAYGWVNSMRLDAGLAIRPVKGKMFKLKTKEEIEADLAAERAKAQAEAEEEAKKVWYDINEKFYDKENDVKIVCSSNNSIGKSRIFNDNDFKKNITKMYVDGKEIPISEDVELENNRKHTIIFKTNGIKEIKKGTFKSFDGKAGTCSILEFHFPACLQKLGAENGAGCSNCSDIYFYGQKAPKGPAILGGYIFSVIQDSSYDMGKNTGRRMVHIMKDAKGFTGLNSNISFNILEKDLGYSFVTM